MYFAYLSYLYFTTGTFSDAEHLIHTYYSKDRITEVSFKLLSSRPN